jgi:hypothetical protein
MKNSLAKHKLTTLLLAAALLVSGCGARPTHSSYFIVAFLPGTPALSQLGVEAMGNAVRQAKSDRPRFIAIDGAVPEGGEPALERQRFDKLTADFVKAGIDAGLIRATLHPASDKDSAGLRDGFSVQLVYGAAPPPP